MGVHRARYRTRRDGGGVVKPQRLLPDWLFNAAMATGLATWVGLCFWAIGKIVGLIP